MILSSTSENLILVDTELHHVDCRGSAMKKTKYADMTKENSVITSSRNSYQARRSDRFQVEPAVALFQTCKQINYEAAPLFYGRITFHLDNAIDCTQFMTHFRARIHMFRFLELKILRFHDQRRARFVRDFDSLCEKLVPATSLQNIYINQNFWGVLGPKPNSAAHVFYNGT